MGKGMSNYEETIGNVGSSFEEGPQSKVGRDSPRNIFFFKSKKRSRRCRRKAGGARTHSLDPFITHGEPFGLY
ncbi:hypothetical protein Hanom_Chr10g00891461 [Helianthus anomalus]